MAATYHTGNPKWLQEKNEGKVDGTNEATMTVDNQATAYQSRADNPQAKLPT